MLNKNPQFGDAVKEACSRRGYSSTRHAEYKTGLDHSLISKMQNGQVPGVKVLMRWAAAIGEPVDKWLELAGHPPVSAPPGNTTSPTDAAPSVPPAVLRAVAEAPTREEKIIIAFDYLRRPELGLQMGGSQMLGMPTESKLALIRLYERMAGVQILPPEVV